MPQTGSVRELLDLREKLQKTKKRLRVVSKVVVGDVDNKDQTMSNRIRKIEPRTLYVCRYLTPPCATEFLSWAKGQGFYKTVPADELHVTVAFSRQPVDWMMMGQANDGGLPYGGGSNLRISEGGPRVVEPLGDQGAVVLLFASQELYWRHAEMERKGASWDFESYQPHMTITYDGSDVDLSQVEPFKGELQFGREEFTEVDDEYVDNLVEKRGARHSRGDTEMLQTMHDHSVKLGATCMGKMDIEKVVADAQIVKVDSKLGLVMGWAIISKINGEDYYDKNRDKSGESVPEHIPEDAMLKAAMDFMLHSRAGNEMHDGPEKGTYVFAWPMTTDIAKAMGVKTNKTGLMVAYFPPKDILDKYLSGELRGFSVEGSRVKSEEHD